MPKVSIIVPVYNTMQWLVECVESIRNQSMRDIEIILIDDGSTDYSGVICDAYCEMDNRIKVVHQKNQGVSSARNKGLELANGKYIMFCDSDDYAMPEWCEKMVSLSEEYPEAWICCSTMTIDSLGKHPGYYSMSKNISIVESCEYGNLLLNGFGLGVCDKIFDVNNIFDRNLKFDDSFSYGEDTFFVMEYWAGKRYGVICSDILFCHRYWQTESLSKKYIGNTYFHSMCKTMELVREFLSSEEAADFMKGFFWWRGLGSLAHILDPRNSDPIDQQIKDCQEIVSSPEFQEWCHTAVSEDTNDPMLRALLDGDFSCAYPSFLEYWEQREKIGLEKWSKTVVSEEEMNR